MQHGQKSILDKIKPKITHSEGKKGPDTFSDADSMQQKRVTADFPSPFLCG
jgi:hypothetical protein